MDELFQQQIGIFLLLENEVLAMLCLSAVCQATSFNYLLLRRISGGGLVVLMGCTGLQHFTTLFRQNRLSLSLFVALFRVKQAVVTGLGLRRFIYFRLLVYELLIRRAGLASVKGAQLRLAR